VKVQGGEARHQLALDDASGNALQDAPHLWLLKTPEC
jgi:hypothetical protein